MSWIVNVWADIPNVVVGEPLLEQSTMFSSLESVGGVQRRISMLIPDADDADSACRAAEEEIARLLGEQLTGIAESAATEEPL